jgi:hypothetical protein
MKKSLKDKILDHNLWYKGSAIISDSLSEKFVTYEANIFNYNSFIELVFKIFPSVGRREVEMFKDRIKG